VLGLVAALYDPLRSPLLGTREKDFAMKRSLVALLPIVCLALAGCGPKGTIATAGTPSERAVCANLATPPPPRSLDPRSLPIS
jgi:hypothetical protein